MTCIGWGRRNGDNGANVDDDNVGHDIAVVRLDGAIVSHDIAVVKLDGAIVDDDIAVVKLDGAIVSHDGADVTHHRVRVGFCKVDIAILFEIQTG